MVTFINQTISHNQNASINLKEYLILDSSEIQNHQSDYSVRFTVKRKDIFLFIKYILLQNIYLIRYFQKLNKNYRCGNDKLNISN